ncbi:MAG: ABC transporter permease [Desulfobacteraceae bacterium]|jgi:peptide/nickel transport system permease protein
MMSKKHHPKLKELVFVLHKFLKNPSAVVGAIILLCFIVVAVAAPYLAKPKYRNNPYKMPHSGYSTTPKPPSAKHIMGTTSGQYDIKYGVVWGTRTMFKVVMVVVLVSLLIGIIIGTCAGYFGGMVDEILMRITDIFFSVPGLILALAIVVAFGRGIEKIMVALILVRWRNYARVMRSAILTIRDMEYVQAAKTMGVTDLGIMVRHIVPNSIYPVAALAFLDIGNIVLAAAFFAFLGLGEAQNYADWGQMVALARNYIIGPPDDPLRYWYTVVFPGAAIVLFVLGWNLIGDALRDAFDPRMRRR